MSQQWLRSCFVASVSALFILGCGGTVIPAATPSINEGSVQAQAWCSAKCSGGTSISCSGSTCQAVDYQYVICDGVRTNCPSPPPNCSATFYCESGPTLSCSGTQCRQLGPLDSKVCGGVECDGVAQYCPPLPGELECY
jgi:hypothetical protein